jgi:FlaA1/EpsC-like NDP-sugar epimerase
LSFGELDRLTDLCLETNLRIYKFGLLDNKKVPAKPSQSIEQFRIEDLLGRDPIKIANEANCKEFRGRRVMVTGAAGSIGSEIVRQLLVYEPKEVILVDHAETPLAELRLELEDKDIRSDIIYRIEDVRRLKAMESVFEQYKPEFVFHAAAYKHVPIMEAQPEQAVENNIAGTAIVADLSMKYGVKKFVFISTDKAVNPANVMGASKRIAERYIQCLQSLSNGKSTTQFITTRFGNVLGSNGSVIPIFARQIANGGPVTITHPDIIRYFMTIPEACQLVLEACTMGQGGQIMIFDMGKPVKILELARKMIHLAGYTPGVDIGIEYTGLRPGEKMYEELINEVSCVQPSHHPKIMILEDPEIEAGSLVMHQIRSLIEKAPECTPAALVRGMKKLVPEFISANSTYEKFDTRDPLPIKVTN